MPTNVIKAGISLTQISSVTTWSSFVCRRTLDQNVTTVCSRRKGNVCMATDCARRTICGTILSGFLSCFMRNRR
jgi:hypothetical protein